MADRRISEIAAVPAQSTELVHGDHLLIERSGSNFAAQIPARWAKTQVPDDIVYDADLEDWADTANPTTRIPHAKLPLNVVIHTGAWSASTTYTVGLLVNSAGNTWMSVTNGNINNTPADSSSHWVNITGVMQGSGTGLDETAVRALIGDWAEDDNTTDRLPVTKIPLRVLRHLGDWVAATTYQFGHLADHDGHTWMSKSDSNTNNEPDDTSTHWVNFTGGGSGGGTGDDAFDWATVGNTDPVPDSKLGGVQPVALVSNQARWGTNKLPTNISYHHVSYSSTATYNPGVTVLYNGGIWKVISNIAVTGSAPSASNDDWARIDNQSGPGTEGDGETRTLIGTTRANFNSSAVRREEITATGFGDYDYIEIEWDGSDSDSDTSYARGFPIRLHRDFVDSMKIVVSGTGAETPDDQLADGVSSRHSAFGPIAQPSNQTYNSATGQYTEERNISFTRVENDISERPSSTAHPDKLMVFVTGNDNLVPKRFTVYGITVATGGGSGGDDAFDWATEGNDDAIPESKLPTNISYHYVTYSSTDTYNPGDTVLHNDTLWKVKASAAVTGSEPASDNDDWAQIDALGTGGVGPPGPAGPEGPAAEGNPVPYELVASIAPDDITFTNLWSSVNPGTTDRRRRGAWARLPIPNWKTFDRLIFVNDINNRTKQGEIDTDEIIGTDATTTGGYPSGEAFVTDFRRSGDPEPHFGDPSTDGSRVAVSFQRSSADEDNELLVFFSFGGGAEYDQVSEDQHNFNGQSFFGARTGTADELFVYGLRVGGSSAYKGAFSTSVNYKEGDEVKSEGNFWKARRDVSASSTVPVGGDDWVRIDGGGSGGGSDRWRGDWAVSNEYTRGDIVAHSSVIWICVLDNGQGASEAAEPTGGATEWRQIDFVGSGTPVTPAIDDSAPGGGAYDIELGRLEFASNYNGGTNFFMPADGWQSYDYVYFWYVTDNDHVVPVGPPISVNRIQDTTESDETGSSSPVQAQLNSHDFVEVVYPRAPSGTQENGAITIVQAATDGDERFLMRIDPVALNTSPFPLSGAGELVIYGARVGSDTYRGDWVSGTAYGTGEWVLYQDNAYLAVRNVNTGLDNNPTVDRTPVVWKQLTGAGGGGSGVDRWRGDFDANNDYTAGDIVAHSGGVWICVVDTGEGGSAQEPAAGAASWKQIDGAAGAPGEAGEDGDDGADGRTPFRGTWASDQTYQQGDFVVDASGDYWFYVNTTAGNTSATPSEGTSWTQLGGGSGGVEHWRGEFATSNNYVAGDLVSVVVSGGREIWIATQTIAASSVVPGHAGSVGWTKLEGQHMWHADRAYQAGDIVLEFRGTSPVGSFSGVYVCIATHAPRATSPTDDTGSHWRSLVGPAGPKGDKGDKGDTGDAGPAGTVPNQAGVPVGWQSLGTPVALSATQLVLNATAWQTYDFLSIMIRETSAPSVSYTGLSFLPVEELKLKTPTDASVSDSNASALADRGNYLQSTNRQFYIGRRITDGDNKLRWATNSTIGGPNRELEVFGIRVGYGNFKGAWVNSATYARGDYVWHSSEFWFVTAATISNSEPTDSNTNYKKLGSGTGGGGGGGDANNYLNALRPRVATVATNVHTAGIGVHAVSATTANLPSNFTIDGDEGVLEVRGTREGLSSNHRIYIIYNVNATGTNAGVWVKFKDDSEFSAWYNITGGISAPAIAFDSDNNELDLTWTNSDGTAGAATAVAIPAKYRGRVETVTLTWPSFGTVRATMLDADGVELGNDDASIVWPAHSRAQWTDQSRTSATIISPQELGRFFDDRSPVANDSAAASENNSTNYRWTAKRVGDRAKNALPAVTVASATTGSSTAQKTVTDAVLKTLLENHTGDAGGIRELGERTVATMGADRLVIEATGFTDYTALIVEIEVGGDSRASEMIPVEFLTRDGLAVYTDGNVRTVGNTHYARSSTTGGVPVQLNIARATTATSSPWTISDNHIAIGTSTTFTNPTIRIWGVRLGAGSGSGSSGGGSGAAGGPVNIGTTRTSFAGNIAKNVNATGWANYDALAFVFDDSETDDDESYRTTSPGIMWVDSLQRGNVPVYANNSFTVRTGLVGGDQVFRVDSSGSLPSQFFLGRVTDDEEAPFSVNDDALIVSKGGGSIDWTRCTVWGINFGGGGGGDSGGAESTFISYAHKNAPNQDEAYAPSVVYGSASDSRVTDETARRKFETGDVLSSSNSNNGLPSATLAFKTGARGGVDHNEGETAAGNLLDGTVFTPGEGTWKIAGDITIDNLDDADQRIVMELWEVVTTGTDDDKILWAEASEGAGAAGENHAATTPTATDLHNFALTARLETPALQFDGVKSYYLTWRLTGGDDDGAWRIRNATLSMSKEA